MGAGGWAWVDSTHRHTHVTHCDNAYTLGIVAAELRAAHKFNEAVTKNKNFLSY